MTGSEKFPVFSKTVTAQHTAVETHRREHYLHFSESPWKDVKESEETLDGKYCPIQEPIEDEWSDLLLELTLATAYANIIENTPILDSISASSFLAFFALVWWIWASQVIYNIRFRTKDWMHSIFSILQFAVFGAMATFTSNFNIFFGLLSDNSQSPVDPVEFQISNTSFNSVFASTLRKERLPVINARGISMVMACSRLLLLIQYLVVLVYSHANVNHKKYQRSLMVHLYTLLFSSGAYVLAAGVIGDQPTKVDDIGKIFLWFIPVLVETGSYFYITRMPNYVAIETKSIHKRSTVLFTVVLGEGLNQITGSFKYVVGAVGFTAKGVTIMLSAGIIIIGEFSLYSRNNWEQWSGNKRTLLWFFSHFALMATLILTLQAVRSLLSFANLHSSIDTLLAMANDITKRAWYGGIKSVTADMFPDAANAFVALGLPFGDFINVVNEGLEGGVFNRTSATKLAQTLIYVASVTFNEFDAFPEQGSTLYNEVQDFLDAPYVNPNKVFTLLGQLLSSRLHSAFWFWGTAGGTLIMLATLSVLKQTPIDKYEFASIVSKLVFGSIFLAFSAFTVGHGRPYFSNADTATINLQTTRPWQIASSPWVIPSFAVTLIIVNCIDIYIGYRAIHSSGPAEKPSDNHDVPNESSHLAAASEPDDVAVQTSGRPVEP